MYIKLIFIILWFSKSNGFLRIENKTFHYNNDKVFLSGVNIAWQSYARDFGSGAYAGVRSQYESYIKEVSKSGGNVIRVWLHIDGQWSPKWDKNGFATGEDTPSLIQELGQMLDTAQHYNIFVIICLWNLAVKPDPMLHLYNNPQKLDSYLNNVLKPLATGLRDKKSLAAWDIINEPQGSIDDNTADGNPCWDTTILKNSGSDWTQTHLPLKDVQRFVNLHSNAIKSVDPKALVTIGDSDLTLTNIASNTRDYFTDLCLTQLGGQSKGTLDFYCLHSYTWPHTPAGKYSPTSPFKHMAADYKSSKPLVVGEWATVCSESQNSSQIYRQLYSALYSGAMSWQYNEGGDCADKRQVDDVGMTSIKDLTDNGKIVIKL